MKPRRWALLVFGLLNAALYSALLPLWEGFDEPAHYGYVESLWRTRSLPVLGRTPFPADVVESLRLAPGSYLMQRWRPDTLTYEQWYRLSGEERARRRAALDALRPAGFSAEMNYQAHHPPLAYAFLAGIDSLIPGSPLPARVLVLRLFGALCSVPLLFFAVIALCRELAVPQAYVDAVLLTMFSAQMLYASVAHVANDWLAIPLAAWCFASIARFVNNPGRRSALWIAAPLAAGLLTKAYFIVFAVWAAVILAMKVRLRTVLPAAALVAAVAGPWYARNLALYGNLSGTFEAFTGVGVREALSAMPHIDWPRTAASLARNSLWMGNNSGTSFSRATLDLALMLLALAIGAWLLRVRSMKPAEKAVAAGIGLYSLAVAYAACAAFACRECTFHEPSPWYTQVLLAPVLALASLGLSRAKRFGALLASFNVGLWTWLIAATWAVKLFPMYSGAGSGPMRVRDLWDWYAHRAAPASAAFSQTALAPAPLLYACLLASLALAALLSLAVIRDLTRGSVHPLPNPGAAEASR